MRRNKFNNTICEHNGIKFHSKLERDFYIHLLTKYKPEHIKLQPKFILQPKFKTYYNSHREIAYTGDFQIDMVVYDVKSVETDIFKIKKKLFAKGYPQMTLQIVRKKLGEWDYEPV